MFSKATPYDKSGQRWKDITNTVAFYIGKDMLPTTLWKKPGFKKLLKILDPKYEPTSRKFFALPRLYNETRERISAQLEEVEFYSTSWRSSCYSPGLCWHYNVGEYSFNHFVMFFVEVDELYACNAFLFSALCYLTYLKKKSKKKKNQCSAHDATVLFEWEYHCRGPQLVM